MRLFVVVKVRLDFCIISCCPSTRQLSYGAFWPCGQAVHFFMTSDEFLEHCLNRLEVRDVLQNDDELRRI